jgi:diadenylate cyclase
MENFFESLSSLWSQVFYAICHITFFDVIDILVIAFLVYKAIDFLRETRAGQLVKGIAVLIIVAFLARWLNLVSLKWLLNTVFESALIAIAIIFQPELRRALEKVGRSNFKFLDKQQTLDEDAQRTKNCIDSVCSAVSLMSDKRIGALIVFERKTMLGEIINTGTPINAEASYELIGNIFFPKSPLHDGALIIRNGYLWAAGCILPLTANNNLNSQLGTRHRAAIGMSENSDAIVLVVSEETGTVSLAINGKIQRDLNSVTLKEELYLGLLNTEDKKRSFFMDVLYKFKKI